MKRLLTYLFLVFGLGLIVNVNANAVDINNYKPKDLFKASKKFDRIYPSVSDLNKAYQNVPPLCEKWGFNMIINTGEVVDAVYEIRAYADVMINSLKRWVPITFDAFMDYRVGGMELSAKGKEVIKKMMKGQKCNLKDSNLSKREWNELMESFGFNEKIL